MKNNLMKSGIVFLAGIIVPGGVITQLLMRNAVNWGADKLTQANEINGQTPIETGAIKVYGIIGRLFHKKKVGRIEETK